MEEVTEEVILVMEEAMAVLEEVMVAMEGVIEVTMVVVMEVAMEVVMEDNPRVTEVPLKDILVHHTQHLLIPILLLHIPVLLTVEHPMQDLLTANLPTKSWPSSD